jgi:hypothetical protein
MREIQLSRPGYVAIVSDEDFDRVIAGGPWFPHVTPETVYAQRTIRDPNNGKRTTQKLGSFILQINDPKTEVKHLDGDGCHGWRENLQETKKPPRPKRSFGLQRRGDKRWYGK